MKASASISRRPEPRGEAPCAEPPRGFNGIMPSEGNVYNGRRYRRTSRLKVNGVPGVCPYTFLYVWMDLRMGRRGPVKYLG